MVKISERLDFEQVSEPARLRTILFMDGHYLIYQENYFADI